jgi:hypothetical protein
MRTPDPPADLTDGLYTAMEEDGRIKFILARRKKPIAHVSLPPEHASEIAANALVAVREAFERARMGLVPRVARTKRDAPMIQVDGLAVGRCTIPDHGVLVVRVGIAELGFAIPKQKLRELGEALVKWSTAEDDIPQQSGEQRSADKGKD